MLDFCAEDLEVSLRGRGCPTGAGNNQTTPRCVAR